MRPPKSYSRIEFTRRILIAVAITFGLMSAMMWLTFAISWIAGDDYGDLLMAAFLVTLMSSGWYRAARGAVAAKYSKDLQYEKYVWEILAVLIILPLWMFASGKDDLRFLTLGFLPVLIIVALYLAHKQGLDLRRPLPKGKPGIIYTAMMAVLAAFAIMLIAPEILSVEYWSFGALNGFLIVLIPFVLVFLFRSFRKSAPTD